MQELKKCNCNRNGKDVETCYNSPEIWKTTSYLRPNKMKRTQVNMTSKLKLCSLIPNLTHLAYLTDQQRNYKMKQKLYQITRY